VTPFHAKNDTSLIVYGEEDFTPVVADALHEKHGSHVRYTRCPCGSITFHITMRSVICAHCVAEITGH
jgi:hypothetical protein